jgi:hypothetical protein
MSDRPDTSGCTIEQSYTQCLDSLKDLIISLNSPPDVDDNPDHSDLSIAIEAYGRLRTWGVESRAAQPAGLQESLDRGLSQNEKLKSTVLFILAKLRRQILFGKSNILA